MRSSPSRIALTGSRCASRGATMLSGSAESVPKGADYDRGRCGFENEGRSRKAQGQLRQGTGVEDKWDPALGEFFTHNLCTPGREPQVDDPGREGRIVSHPQCRLEVSCKVDDCALALERVGNIDGNERLVLDEEYLRSGNRPN